MVDIAGRLAGGAPIALRLMTSTTFPRGPRRKMDINQIPPSLRSVPPAGDAAKDPDGGQVMGPHGEAPEDPVARSVRHGCLLMVLVVGLVMAVLVVLYQVYVAA